MSKKNKDHNYSKFREILTKAYEKNMMYPILFDLVFAGVCQLFLAIYTWIILNDKIVKMAQSTTLQEIAPTSNPDVLLQQTYVLIAKALFFAALFIVLGFIIYVVTRHLMWNLIVHKKIKLKQWKTFFRPVFGYLFVCLIMSVIYIAIRIIQVFSLVAFPTEMVYYIFAVLLAGYIFICIHMTFIYYYTYMKHKKITKAYSELKDIGLKRIQEFIPHYVFAIVVSWVIFSGVGYGISYVLLRTDALSLIPLSQMVWSLLVTIVCLAWLRNVTAVILEK